MVTNEEYLRHYGVIGMKWGKHRSDRKAAGLVKLERKALAYDTRAANLTKISEKRHSKYDLGAANRAAKKAANYEAMSAKAARKAAGTTDEFNKARLENTSSKFEYRSKYYKMKANRISKQKGYGVKAMYWSIKSDKVALRAAQARRKLASDKKYIAAMNRKISTISAEDLAGAYAFLTEPKN